MKLDFWISRRLNVRRGAQASTATGVVIAVAGVALALMVMEIALAVVVGFKSEIRRKVIGFDSYISVLPAYDYDTATTAREMSADTALLDIISEVVPNAAVSQSLRREAILKTDSDFAAVQCVAHDSEHDDSFERGNMVAGSWPDFNSVESKDSLVISASLASRLSLATGDKVFLYFFVDGEVKVRRSFISGLYQTNFGEYDNTIVYSSLVQLRGLGNDSLATTSVDIQNVPFDSIAALSSRLQSSLTDAAASGRIAQLHPVTNVLSTGALYFNWLELLDTNVIVIFALMLCVAAFTLISSLFIIILDRVSTIGILRALGASKSFVRRVFINIAMRLVGLGMIIGNVLGLGLIYIQDSTHLLPLNPDMYYLDYIPVQIGWGAVLLLNVGVAVGAWLILILPAGMASRIDPASTMRYE